MENNGLEEISQNLVKQIKKRLLMVGIPTNTILEQYINILKILQEIDSGGRVFEEVAKPIQQYLLSRRDTLKCIIQHLTEDSRNYASFLQDFIKLPSNNAVLDYSSSDHMEVENSPQKNKWFHYETDLITVLANLYGSEDDFIKEYHTNLANKFINYRPNILEEEIKNIELLKQRFGENHLNVCMIIIKDVKESHKISQSINKDLQFPFEFNVLILSKEYWPIQKDKEDIDNQDNHNQNQQILMPSYFHQIYDQFQQSFKKMNALRKLQWEHNMGQVEIQLIFNQVQHTFKCQPYQAIIISYFDESIYDPNKGISAFFFTSSLQLDYPNFKAKINYWIHKNVIIEVKNDQDQVLKDLYFLNNNFQQSINNENIVCNFENTQENSDITYSPDMINKMIEKKIIEIIENHGPKSVYMIQKLFEKKIYSIQNYFNIQENKLNEVLKNMLINNILDKYGDVYYLVEKI